MQGQNSIYKKKNVEYPAKLLDFFEMIIIIQKMIWVDSHELYQQTKCYRIS